MTITEAIKLIREIKDGSNVTNEHIEALNLAIQALSTMPFVHDMSNTIDRLRRELDRE